MKPDRASRAIPLAVAAVTLASLCVARPLAAQSDPLGDLVREAWRRNLTLEQELLRELESEAEVREARGQYLPSLSLSARYSETRGVLNIGDLVNPAYEALNQLTGSQAFPTNIDQRLPLRQETTLRLTQPLYNPAIRQNHRLRGSLRDVQAAARRMAARQLAADVQVAVLNHAQAVRVAELYRNTLELLNENVRVNERLLEAGKVTPDVVFRARAERSEAEQLLAEAEQHQAASARYVNLLLNRPLTDPLDVVPDSVLRFPLEITREEAEARALVGREELWQVEHGIEAAEAQHRLAGTSYLPTVALAVDYGIQGDQYRFGRDHDFVVGSLVLQWDLFQGGRTAARRQRAGLEIDRRQVQRRELERQIRLQVGEAYDAAVVARQAIATAEDRAASARSSFRLVARRHEQGAAAQIEYLDARTAMTNAELGQILARYEYAARFVELERVAALRSVPEDE